MGLPKTITNKKDPHHACFVENLIKIIVL